SRAAGARCPSTRCARTARTGAGAATTLRPPHIPCSRSRSAGRLGRSPAPRSLSLLGWRCGARLEGDVSFRPDIGIGLGQRESDLEPGVTGNRLYVQIPVVLVDHDPPGDVEPEPGALAHRLGGEERLGDTGADLLRAARGRVRRT